MWVDLSLDRFDFRSQRGSISKIQRQYRFSSPVHQALASINGFDIGYLAADHELYRMTVDAHIDSIQGNEVTLTVTFGLRDASGHFDDLYSGWVEVGLTVVHP
ncbi:hypothetical protein [Geodermatophilus sp. SYSU D00805]